jgi:ketosteroid isomerase-like protein
MASTLEVGKKLVELCRAGKNLEAIDTLYDKDIVSIEVHGDETMPARMQGIDAIRGKNNWWFENHQIHSGEVKGPFPHGDRFITFMKYDVTSKVGPYAGKRMTVEEAGLYTVRNGKIVQEEFFYDMPG